MTTAENNKIAILGGTFDPVHNGHLKIADLVIKQLNFSQVIFIPNNTQPHRSPAIASPQQRLAMLELAIKGNQHYSINPCELERKGLSYTIDTIEYLSNNLKDMPPWLIVGLDAFYTLPAWHNYEKLIELCNFIVINRKLPNSQNLTYKSWADNYINTHRNDKIIFLNAPAIDISSTEIRQHIFTNNINAIKSLIPEQVLQYIIQNNLYNGPPII